MSEAVKILPTIKKYMKGVIWDLGCHNSLVVPEAIGIDRGNFPNVKYSLDFNENFKHLSVPDSDIPNVIFASHVLEHVINPHEFINTCYDFLQKKRGRLILYLPSCHHYDNINNQEHLHDFSYEVFVRWFKKSFGGKFRLNEHDFDYDQPDKYSFHIVAEVI